jgi:hypothetical protein
MSKSAVAFLVYFLVTVLASFGAYAYWADERDADLGFRFSYPTELFQRVDGDQKPSFHYYVSRDERAKFMAGAWNNEAGQTPSEFKQWLLSNAGGYDDTTYRPRGRNWFVMSGYRGDDIYYEKVIFSCGGKVVNVLAITYPSSLRQQYDPVVERMEDNFAPRKGCYQR